MRHIFLVVMAFIGGGMLAGIAVPSASAAPFPYVAGGVPAAAAVETIGYWRR
jgi:hypothetical protein